MHKACFHERMWTLELSPTYCERYQGPLNDGLWANSQHGGWIYCLWPEMRILPTWSKWRLVIWWLQFQMHRLLISLWDTEIFKLYHLETQKCVIFSLIYLPTYEWFSFSYSLCKKDGAQIFVWTLIFLRFAFCFSLSFAVEGNVGTGIQRELWWSLPGPSSAELGAQDSKGLLCPRAVPQGGDTPTVCFGYTSCTDAHSCFVEDIGSLQSKVVAFCQEAFISLLAALHGQCLIPCQGSDVASCFQIVDTTHLRSSSDLCAGRATGEIFCIQRLNFIYLEALDTEVPHSFMGFFKIWMKMHEPHGLDVIHAVLLLLMCWNLPKWSQVWVILGHEGIVLVVKAQLHNQMFPILARCFSHVKPSPQPWCTFLGINIRVGLFLFRVLSRKGNEESHCCHWENALSQKNVL